MKGSDQKYLVGVENKARLSDSRNRKEKTSYEQNFEFNVYFIFQVQLWEMRSGIFEFTIYSRMILN